MRSSCRSPNPDLGELRLQREPYLFGDALPSEAPRPAPALGADTAEARNAGSPEGQDPGTEPRQRRSAALTPSDDRQPLRGLRVLDLGVGAVVPEAAEQLALLGADVIKIESQQRLDFLRLVRVNDAPSFNQLNLGCAASRST